MSLDSILRMDHIIKNFPGVLAVDDVSFELKRGEIHSLLGHNGAGKSTLVKIISGAYQRDSGEIVLDGHVVNFSDPGMAIRSGIHMVYQELDLIPYLSGAENIYLGQGRFHNRFGLINHSQKLKAAKELIKRLDVEIDLNCPVTELSVSKQQIIAIAKAISSSAKVIIFDEPTSALNDSETNKLFKIMRWLVSEGVSIILITHRLDEIFKIADRVTVMRDGKCVLVRGIGEVTKAEIMKHMTSSGSVREVVLRNSVDFQETVLRCENIGAGSIFRDVSFELHQGEVLGITGLIGCGAVDVARAIYGAIRCDSGQVWLNGLLVKPGNTEDAASKGLAFVPEDRKRDGLVLINTTKTNITLTMLNKLSRLGFINRSKESKSAQKMIEKLEIRVASENQIVGTLSGGNQQKVALSKWLLKESPVLLLCEPTRGIDVVTKGEIWHMIREFAANGKSVLVISSEIDEILATSDRILVLYEGRIFGEMKYFDFDRAKIINWMYGVN